MNLTNLTKINSPTISFIEWSHKEVLWKQLIIDIDGPKSVQAIEIKLFYITGLIYQICESVRILLINNTIARQFSYMPAIGLYLSAIELLGRCVSGQIQHHKSTLASGLQWVHTPIYQNYNTILKNAQVCNTSNGSYTIADLLGIRNYSAHGQATSDFYTLDYEILSVLHEKVIIALSNYWIQIGSSEDLCNNLIMSNIIPFRASPILKIMSLVQEHRDIGTSIINIFSRFKQGFRI